MIDDLVFECKCSTANDRDGVSGSSCQYADLGTTMCVSGNEVHDIGASGAFCSNGGKCKNILSMPSSKFYGCQCPDGFGGFHCELRENELQGKDYGIQSIGLSKRIGVDVIFFMCVVVICMIFVSVKLRRRRRYRNKNLNAYSMLSIFNDAGVDTDLEINEEELEFSSRVPSISLESRNAVNFLHRTESRATHNDYLPISRSSLT